MNIEKYFLAAGVVCILSIIFLTACSKETSPGDKPGKAVVEGYLAPGSPVEVKITKEIPYGSGDTLLPLPNLSVFIISNGVSYPLTYMGNAIYGNPGIVVDTGIIYQLQFEYNGAQVSASTKIPYKPTNFTGSDTVLDVPVPGSGGSGITLPTPITYSWDNPNNDYHLLVVKCIESSPVAIDTARRLLLSSFFRTKPNQAKEQDIGFQKFSYYGRHEVILYRIWAEYAALYESNEGNSNNLATPPGNITNGWGIFTGINTTAPLYVTVQ